MSIADPSPKSETWPRKLNKALIAVGIIAFGLIVTDRLLQAFRADDPPTELSQATVEAPLADPSPGADLLTVAEQLDPQNAGGMVVQPEVPVSESITPEVLVSNEPEVLMELESLFGSKVVFVSASEPAFLVTADEKRYDVGGAVDDQTTLAGITAQQVLFEKAGDLIVISLPEPSVQ